MENINKKFEMIPIEEKNINEIVRKSMSFWQDTWRRLKKDKLAMIGLVVVIIITLIAIFAPYLTKFSYSTQNLKEPNVLPNIKNLFGTDQYGRDLFTRVIYGARISMTVAYVSTILILIIGSIYGGISGYIGGTGDNIMMRIVDILSGIPSMLYLILLMVVLGPGLKSIIISMAISGWLGMARMVRSQVLSLKEQDYLLAAKTLGVKNSKILLRHLLPNCMGVIIVNLTFAVPGAIFTEAFLSFIGLGISAPQASWGVLASDAVETYMMYPHELLFPSLAICITILAFNFLGDGLRDALDPQMRK